MKYRIFILFIGLIASTSITAKTSLLQLFENALTSDPIYQQVLEQTLANAENIGISRAALLPSINMILEPNLNQYVTSGEIVNFGIYPPRVTVKAMSTELKLTQTVFNISQLMSLSNAKLGQKQALANLSAALQNLMLRVAQAYLKIVYDQESLAYYQANKISLAHQLSDTKQLYKSGARTITDVYAAQSAYSTSEARYLTAETLLATDKQFISTITGEETITLDRFRDDFKVTTPVPANMEAWVDKAKEQNWTIRASKYGVEAARELIKQSTANHLPTLDINAYYNTNSSIASASSFIFAAGQSQYQNRLVALRLAMPIFEGGLIVSRTKQALHNYKLAGQLLESTFRTTIYNTRQSFLNIMADIQKIKADQAGIQASISALQGMRDRYKSGGCSIVDVLNEQEKVLQTKSQYAADRYSYLINYLSLKNAAGTLSVNDLQIINAWLA